MRVAIVISTQYGQTAKIAERVSQVLDASGHEVQTFLLKTEMDFPAIDLDKLDAVVIGSPLHSDRFAWQILDWGRLYCRTLNTKYLAFFSVSLLAMDRRPAARQEEAGLMQEFLSATKLDLDLNSNLIGAVNYTKYGWMRRRKLMRVCKAAGAPTDTAKDHELTDWAAVEAFAKEFARILTQPLAPAKVLAQQA